MEANPGTLANTGATCLLQDHPVLRVRGWEGSTPVEAFWTHADSTPTWTPSYRGSTVWGLAVPPPRDVGSPVEVAVETADGVFIGLWGSNIPLSCQGGGARNRNWGSVWTWFTTTPDGLTVFPSGRLSR